MHKQLLELISQVKLTGDMQNDILTLLSNNGHDELTSHSIKVANEAKKIASRYGVCEEKAFIAGLLHDTGRLIPTHLSVDICNSFGIQIFEEEKLYPSILHGKLSSIIASNAFKVDSDICNALECHSTLKAKANKLEMVLFVADKISWEREFNGEFIDEMIKGLDSSLECGAIKFIEYLHNGHAEILHPWSIDAYDYLKGICK